MQFSVGKSSKKYLSFFRIRFINGLQYRIAALSGAATQFVWGVLLILLYHAFYEADPDAFPMRLSDLVSYIWLQQAFFALYQVWSWENELFELIQTGNVAYELCRPYRLYDAWFFRIIATRMANAVLRCFPILLLAPFLPDGYRLSPPENWMQLACFLLSLFLALLVVAAFQMVIHSLTFYLLNAQGLKVISQTISSFLCGDVIPLPFFPESAQTLLAWLPFASMGNAPFRIYSGDIAGAALPETLFRQLFWILLLMLVGRFLMRQGLKKTLIQGG
ncbi:MAG: ABC transporter permease [Lachnospiraceae bacterium]|jgi:ABC-2 type transport system permease protein|nr:ABC transporter permease [Lachnospiraceae bacterium]